MIFIQVSKTKVRLKVILVYLNIFQPLQREGLCIKWLEFLHKKCYISVEPLKLKLEVFTSITSSLFYFKLFVILCRGKMAKTVIIQILLDLHLSILTQVLFCCICNPTIIHNHQKTDTNQYV